MYLEEGKTHDPYLQSRTGRLPSAKRAPSSGHSWPLCHGAAITACLPQAALPQMFMVPPPSPAAVSLSVAPLHYMPLQNETRGSQSPAPRGWVEGNNLELEWGGRSGAWGGTAGVSNRYRKHRKVQINVTQSSCLHSKWSKNSPLICFQSQVNGHTDTGTHTRNLFTL